MTMIAPFVKILYYTCMREQVTSNIFFTWMVFNSDTDRTVVTNVEIGLAMFQFSFTFSEAVMAYCEGYSIFFANGMNWFKSLAMCLFWLGFFSIISRFVCAGLVRRFLLSVSFAEEMN